MNAEAAREHARQNNGQFGDQLRPDAEVTLSGDASASPTEWTMEVAYVDGATENFSGDTEGHLPSPVRSDNLKLVRLLGFRNRDSFSGVDVTLAGALADTASTGGLKPVFETYDGETSLRAEVTVFQAN